MKISSLSLFFTLSTAPAMAQVAAPNLAPLRAPKMATVTSFISGLKEPQGMAFENIGPDSNILIADYQTGEILKFGSKGGRYPEPLAKGLKGPTTLVKTVTDLYVSERDANRVLRFEGTDVGFVFPPFPLGDAVEEPTGLAFRNRTPRPSQIIYGPPEWATLAEEVMVISPTTSKVSRFLLSSEGEQRHWQSLYVAPVAEKNLHDYRGLVFDGGALFITDAIAGQVLMLNSRGRIATFATNISKPSGLAIGLDKMLYVANEGDGGQLIRLNDDGQQTIVAEKLGRPSGILCLDAKTLLVSNRDGNIWKIGLP